MCVISIQQKGPKVLKWSTELRKIELKINTNMYLLINHNESAMQIKETSKYLLLQRVYNQ